MRRCLALIALVFMASAVPSAGSVTFKRDFAPQDGIVAPQERPCRDQLCLNGRWQFQPVAVPKDHDPKQGAPELAMPTAGAWEKTPIKIPSPWNVNSFSEGDGGDYRTYPSYPKSWETVDMGWLRRTFRVPSSWRAKRILLDIEAVAGDCRVLVNGKDVASQFDIFLPLKVDITDAVRLDGENELLVGVRKPALFNVQGKYGVYTYPTGSFWGLHVAGIWQDVYLVAVPATHVSDVFVKPFVDRDMLAMDLKLRNDSSSASQITVSGKVYPWVSDAGTDILSAPEPRWHLGGKPVLDLGKTAVGLQPGQEVAAELSHAVAGKLALWTPETPRLYGAVIEVSRDGKTVDRKYVRFGWRQFGIKGRTMTLNGKPIQAKGDAWHFMGVPQMTRRYAWSWFKMLKDANGNALRPHAQVYPDFYLDMADEMGIMVLDESAIWGSHCAFNYDEPVTWDRFMSHAKGLVMRDRNHPAVFGWSLENEVNAALGVSRTSEQYNSQVDDKLAEIAHEMAKLDPTRKWISADGDDDLGGRLPVIVAHYGNTDLYHQLAKRPKPYGVGEATSAYYSLPTEASQYSGDRAFASFEGRMEAIAIEAYDLLARGQRQSASYCSVFNLAWYGMKSQPLGLKDTGGAPTLSDGVFFGKYVEGKPGVQPERIGPYSSAFNPGYDPRLPLYDPWPMFDAVRAAYAPGKPAPSKWDHKVTAAQKPMPPLPANPIEKVAFDGDSTGQLYFGLCTAGVPIAERDHRQRPIISTRPPLSTAAIPTAEGDQAVGDSRLLVIDGASTADVASTRRRMDSVLSRGGTVLIWNLSRENLATVNRLLPVPVELTARKAMSVVPVGSSTVTSALSYGDLYFAEMPMGREILEAGMSGPFVKQGKVLLKACDTDWSRWNDRPENIKTGSVLRSERERKPEGAALVEMASGKGRILVCNLKSTVFSPKHMTIIRKLMAGLGVRLSEPQPMPGGVFDALGYLRNALVCGGIGAASYDAAFNTDLIGGEATIEPKLGDVSGGRPWEQKPTDERSIFDFNKGSYIGGEHGNCAAYLSFWLYSPRPLDQLLAQPDMPKIDLVAAGDDGVKIWLNGRVLIQDSTVHPLIPDQLKCPNLALKQGWNHFMIKVGQGYGEWQFTARLQCTDPRFMASLKSSLSKPE